MARNCANYKNREKRGARLSTSTPFFSLNLSFTRVRPRQPRERQSMTIADDVPQ